MSQDTSVWAYLQHLSTLAARHLDCYQGRWPDRPNACRSDGDGPPYLNTTQAGLCRTWENDVMAFRVSCRRWMDGTHWTTISRQSSMLASTLRATAPASPALALALRRSTPRLLSLLPLGEPPPPPPPPPPPRPNCISASTQ